MKRVNLDFSQCATKEDVHAYLKKEFGFPEYYGNNFCNRFGSGIGCVHWLCSGTW